MKFVIFFIFFCFVSKISFGQLVFGKMYKTVLLKNKIDKPYSFVTNEHDKVILKYLGTVKTKTERCFKIITEKFIWGPNHHTSGRISIFNSENRYVGEYHLGDAFQLPTKLKHSNLIFRNTQQEDCDKTILTIISLKKGLPKKIYRDHLFAFETI